MKLKIGNLSWIIVLVFLLVNSAVAAGPANPNLCNADYDCLVDRAVEFIRTGDEDNARIFLRTALVLKPKERRVFRVMGQMTLDEGRAIDLKRASDYELAAQAKKKSYELALAAFVRYTELSPESDPTGYRLQGDVFADMREHKEAIRLYRKVLARDPKAEEVRVSLAYVLLDQAWNNGEAIRELEAEVHQRPQNVTALTILGSLYRYQGKLELAASAFWQILRLNPGDTSASFDLAMTQRKAGRLVQATRTLAAAKTADPERWGIYESIYGTSQELEKIRAAEEGFRIPASTLIESTQ